MGLNRYIAFGLIIESEIMLPELPVYDGMGNTDVVICLSDRLTEPLDFSKSGAFFKATEDTFFLQIEHVGHFLVQDGREIFIELDDDHDVGEVRLYLLGSVMAALLHQRHVWPLHAGAIDTAEGAILFAGRSGSGKSTILQSLVRHGGYQVITDDLAAITSGEDNWPLVLPGIPRLKLWAESATHFGLDLSELHLLRPNEDKYDVPVNSQFVPKPVRLARIYILDPRVDGELEVTRLGPMEVTAALLHHTFRGLFMAGPGQLIPHLHLVTATAAQVPVYALSWPHSWTGLQELGDHLTTEGMLI